PSSSCFACLWASLPFCSECTATAWIYTLSLHDALPILHGVRHTGASDRQHRSIWNHFIRGGTANQRDWYSHGAGSATWRIPISRSEEHTSELQSQSNLVCRLLLEKKTNNTKISSSTASN